MPAIINEPSTKMAPERLIPDPIRRDGSPEHKQWCREQIELEAQRLRENLRSALAGVKNAHRYISSTQADLPHWEKQKDEIVDHFYVLERLLASNPLAPRFYPGGIEKLVDDWVERTRG